MRVRVPEQHVCKLASALHTVREHVRQASKPWRTGPPSVMGKASSGKAHCWDKPGPSSTFVQESRANAQRHAASVPDAERRILALCNALSSKPSVRRRFEQDAAQTHS